MKLFACSGEISLGPHGEGDDLLFVGGTLLAKAFVEACGDPWNGRVRAKVSIRYGIAHDPIEDLDTAAARMIAGADRHTGMAEGEFIHCYSEITGYLWTDEELKTGGHDLLKELRAHAGKYAVVKIQIHEVVDD